MLIGIAISIIKIIFLLGFLIFIHESGHFLVAKLCKVKVNQFSIGFGPNILVKEYRDTKYTIKLIPLGGFVSMEGEEEISEKEGSFSKASIIKRIAIVSAGAIVNIIFGILIYMILIAILTKNISNTFLSTGRYISLLGESIKMLFTGKVTSSDLTGPIGISNMVLKTSGISEYIFLMSMISVSLGITNLLPIPALDGGKIVLLIIEAIRRKPLKEGIELQLQLIGFTFLIALSIFITYNDIIKII